ncbi:signal transduction histidine kinase [Aquimarina sp. MAR_2010_214]|uniref:ATP-binding protein n=1 Tax=Aquimarina sp. MAR_2010_214 TaxID=1250026 RepID=UPI000C7000B2|nr:tetratricopeptide repeat-containing sensor histidine kinase [Aquimarina sp. MAR_2010_214]PKV53164.1 signal transduction histidine kinase [Aquimarina sp. MAR_2010_214]
MFRSLFNIICISLFLCLVSCDDQNQTDKDIKSISDQIDSYIEKAKDKNRTNQQRKNSLEEAYKVSSALNNSSFKISRLQNISYVYYDLKDLRHYKLLNEEVLGIAHTIDDSLNIAKSYFYLGIYYRSSKSDVAFKNFHKAENIYALMLKNGKNLNTISFDYGKVLIDLAHILRKAKDYTKSESLTIKAIESFELAENDWYIPMCYTNLGIIAKHLEQYDDAIDYYLKAIKYAKGTDKEVLQKVLSYNNIGTVYKSQQKYDQAKGYYHKGLSYTEFLNKNPRRHSLLLDNLAYVNFLSKDTADIPNLFYKALKIRDSIDDKFGIATNTLHLAEYYQFIQEDSIAKVYAERSRDVSLVLQNNGELLQSYKLLSEIWSGDKGLEYANKYMQLNDSIIKRERIYRDKFARIRFETKEKEQQIIEVQNKNTIYLLGILLLLTSIGFVIYFFRQRTRYLGQQNKIIQFEASYETETRISKQLHDELGNDIFQLMMQYQNDPHDSQIKDKLNITYLKARDISRENNEFETGETYPEELNNILQNYTQKGIQLIVIGFDRIDWDEVDKTIKITVYRVLQELMTNMQKHSQASLVKLKFSNTNDTLTINYSDNGVGMTEEDVKSKNGLRNTENRIRAIRGTLIFDSEKGKGFKAEIQIPN